MTNTQIIQSKFSYVLPIRFFGVSQFFGENKFFIMKDGKEVSYYETVGLKGHNGIDFPIPAMEPLIAPFDGTVYYTLQDKGYGNAIWLRTPVFEAGESKFYITCVLAHLESFSVKTGDSVKIYQKIGVTDNTGMSSGYHLHFGIRPMFLVDEIHWQQEDNGYSGYVDPYPFLNDKLSDSYEKFWKTIFLSSKETLHPDRMLPVDKRYGRYWPGDRPWHTYVSEKKVLAQLALKGYKAGVDFTDRELRAMVYGGWGVEDVLGDTGISETKTWQLRKKYA